MEMQQTPLCNAMYIDNKDVVQFRISEKASKTNINFDLSVITQIFWLQMGMVYNKQNVYSTHECCNYTTEGFSEYMQVHSQFMTKIQVGHSDKSWSNLGRLTFDQGFTS